jgi:hypothetical protein
MNININVNDGYITINDIVYGKESTEIYYVIYNEEFVSGREENISLDPYVDIVDIVKSIERFHGYRTYKIDNITDDNFKDILGVGYVYYIEGIEYDFKDILIINDVKYEIRGISCHMNHYSYKLREIKD